MTRLLRAAARAPRLAALLLALAAPLAPQAAGAHAQFRDAAPPAGAVVAEPPPQVALRFNEPVSPLAFTWTFPGGAGRVVEGRAEDERVVVATPADAPRGTHVLSWRVVSSDGHPIAGAHVFSIGAPSAAPEVEGGGGTARPAAVARGVLTLALAFGAGGCAWAAVAGGAPAGRATRALAWGVLPAGLALVAAQGLDLAGSGPAALATPKPWRLALASPVARTAGLGVLAALLALLLPRAPAAGWAVLGLAGLSFAASGHAATAEPAWLMAPLVALHGAALVLWAGALPALAASLRRGPAEVLRFSGLAVPMVAALAASGGVLAWVQLGRPDALWSTGYGRLLLLKLALVALLLALAARNRVRLTPRLRAGEPAAAPSLRRAIRAEVVLVALVLALASGFRLAPPPRALAEAPSAASVHLHGTGAAARLALTPGRAGPNRVEVTLSDSDGAPLVPLEVTLAAERPEEGLGPVVVALRRDADGLWRADALALPAPGMWALRLDALVSDFERTRLQGTVEVAP